VWPTTDALSVRRLSDAVAPPTCTRRSLLVGGAAAAVAAALGLAGYDKRQQIRDRSYRLAARLESDNVPPRSRGLVVDTTFDSDVLRTSVGYSLALPPGAKLGDPLPVCFCLPGRGDTAASVTGEPLYMADFLGQAVSEGTSRFALAAVDGGQSYWHRRASGEDRMAMLIEEFVPLCTERHKLGGSRKGTAIMGWSMGGYGALLAAETNPALFSACVAASPALWTSYEDMYRSVSDAFDSQADFDAYGVFDRCDRLSDTAVLLQCGTGDPFYEACRNLADSLPEGAQVAFSWGNHTPVYWRSIAPRQIDFLGKVLSG